MSTGTSLWINGDWRECSDTEISHHFAHVYGRGARLVLPVVRGSIRFLQESVLHLELAINTFGKKCPDISLDLELWVQRLTAADTGHCQIELIAGICGISEQPDKCSVLHLARLVPWYDAAIRLAPISAVSSPWVRLSRSPLAGISGISGLERDQLLSYAHTFGCDEGLWLNEDGYAVEFAARSLLWMSEDHWYRPSETLNPTWNPAMKQLSRAVDIAQRKVSVDQLSAAQVVLGLNSLGTLSAITAIDDAVIGESHYATDSLAPMLENIVFG